MSRETDQENNIATTGRAKQLTIMVPGSSGNLGPGFDALALALAVYTKLKFTLTDDENQKGPIVQFHGALAHALSSDKSNLIERTLKYAWKDNPELLRRAVVEVESAIPLARGLGSSASAAVGAAWAANYFLDTKVCPDTVLAQATAIEGHPDNAAASLFGGMVVCACKSESVGAGSPRPHLQEILTQKLAWPDKWKTLLVVPHYTLATAEARAVLPTQVSLADGTSNVQNACMVVAAVANSDDEALSFALRDKFHEPYRERLVAELPELRKDLTKLPILGCVLSGAGSSILVIVADSHKQEVFAHLNQWTENKGMGDKILDLNVDNQGVQQVNE
jgi:homoserine kinase